MIDTAVNLEVVPLRALRWKTRDSLSFYLDVSKILQSPDGLSRDWRGLLHLSGLTQYHATNMTKNSTPTSDLIKILEKKPTETLATFRKMLGDIDRWDVIDDTNEMFYEDAIVYLTNKEKSERSTSSQAQLAETSNGVIYDSNRLTLDDNNILQHYDAFILFADNDIDFATEMIEHLENYGFKLCIKERDFLAGINFEHDAIRQLLTERCERLIVILSPDFIESPLNEFISNLAQSLGISQRKRKIIPCLYKPCDLPEIFQHIHLLKYQRAHRLFNFWEKLRSSLRSTPEELIANQCPVSITVTDTDNATVTTPLDNSRQQTSTLLNSVPEPVPPIPHKRNNNNNLLKLNSLPPPSTSLPVTPDSLRKFWPPQPKLRAATSMVNLTDLDLTETNNNNCSGTMEKQTKKPKWYSKLSHTLKKSGSDINLSKEKEKNKKNIWRRIKLVS